MSKASCASHELSTSICTADALLDIRNAFDIALTRSICVAQRQRERSSFAVQSTSCCRRQHIEFERSEKYIELERSESI